MNRLKKIGSTVLVLGALSVAPIIPAGNGVISVAVFENAAGEVMVRELSDAQYAKMGEKGGAEFNPDVVTSTDNKIYTFKTAFQYPTNTLQPLPPDSATSSSAQALREIHTFEDTDAISLFEYLKPEPLGAAIAFDAAVGGNTVGAAATSLTYAKTNTGSNLYLVVAVQANLSQISTVKYNAASTTALVSETVSSSANRIYGLANPSTGTNNVVITVSTAQEFRSVSGSYTGVVQTTSPVDNTGSTTNADDPSTSLTLTITPVSTGAWMISTGGTQRNPSAGTGSTLRTSAGSETAFRLFDSNGSLTGGVGNSMTITYGSCSANCMSMAGITLAPAAVATTDNGQDLIIINDE